MRNIFFKFFFVYVLVFIASVPFPHAYIPDLAAFLHPFFEGWVKLTGKYILNIQEPYTTQLVSDSTGLYVHLANLFIFSSVVALTWTIVEKKEKTNRQLFYWFTILLSYFLALNLFEYGFNKLFKWQFYLPEPNILFSTVGNTPRDMLYWTTMGLSRSYTMFAGLTEIIAAALLLFKRTRLGGATLAFIVLTNVCVINFSYDISVKVFSGFLLLLSAIIITPDSARLFSFFAGRKVNGKTKDTIDIRSKPYYPVLKILVIVYMLFSTLSVYFTENNFNDDKAVRPEFHGAYDVIAFIKNGDSIAPLLTDTSRWRRVFVHRRGYFITQFMNDEMQDYLLLTDTDSRRFIIEQEDDSRQFNLNYIRYPDSTLGLYGIINKDSLSVRLKAININELPALQNEFNWTIDY